MISDVFLVVKILLYTSRWCNIAPLMYIFDVFNNMQWVIKYAEDNL